MSFEEDVETLTQIAKRIRTRVDSANEELAPLYQRYHELQALRTELLAKHEQVLQAERELEKQLYPKHRRKQIMDILFEEATQGIVSPTREELQKTLFAHDLVLRDLKSEKEVHGEYIQVFIESYVNECNITSYGVVRFDLQHHFISAPPTYNFRAMYKACGKDTCPFCENLEFDYKTSTIPVFSTPLVVVEVDFEDE